MGRGARGVGRGASFSLLLFTVHHRSVTSSRLVANSTSGIDQMLRKLCI